MQGFNNTGNMFTAVAELNYFFYALIVLSLVFVFFQKAWSWHFLTTLSQVCSSSIQQSVDLPCCQRNLWKDQTSARFSYYSQGHSNLPHTPGTVCFFLNCRGFVVLWKQKFCFFCLSNYVSLCSKLWTLELMFHISSFHYSFVVKLKQSTYFMTATYFLFFLAVIQVFILLSNFFFNCTDSIIRLIIKFVYNTNVNVPLFWPELLPTIRIGWDVKEQPSECHYQQIHCLNLDAIVGTLSVRPFVFISIYMSCLCSTLEKVQTCH